MYRNYFFNKKHQSELIVGFSLIELLVSVSIILLVMGVVMARQGSYNGAVLLRSQAYDVALQLREAQLSAVSAVGADGEFRNVVGLYFSTTEGAKGHYLTFRDGDVNFFYDEGEETGKRNNLDKRFEISEIRLVGDEGIVENLSVVFERPNFDALFYANEGDLSNASAVEIDVRLKGTIDREVDEVRKVIISRTGQITVE